MGLHAAGAASDSECLSALQTGPSMAKVEAQMGNDDYKCDEGPWCSALISFSLMFDSNNPWQMQKGFDSYSEFANREEGIKVAVTKDHFYEMYHGNVAMKLSEFLPQGLFAWQFGPKLELMQPSSDEEIKVVRNGTISFHLGWWRRKMFWKSVVKSLPRGQVFPYSHVTKFDDCTDCPAKMVLTLKSGGLTGIESKGWKIVDVALIKLA